MVGPHWCASWQAPGPQKTKMSLAVLLVVTVAVVLIVIMYNTGSAHPSQWFQSNTAMSIMKTQGVSLMAPGRPITSAAAPHLPLTTSLSAPLPFTTSGDDAALTDTTPLELDQDPSDETQVQAQGGRLAAWLQLVTPVAYLVLSLTAVWRMAQHGQWPWQKRASEEPALGQPALVQLRASYGMKKGGGYGERHQPSIFDIVKGYVTRVGSWIVRTAQGFMRWVRNSPIDVIMLSIFLCSWFLWLNPSLESVFLVQGFRHPLAFLMSGFSCFNIYQLYSDIFYVYILGKAYCVEFSPKELAVLYGGGTMAGSLLVALTPGGWMGPTAGTAALLTAFMLRYPGTPMAIPMIPLIFFPFQVRWIGTILALANFYLFSHGVASGAAFTGGVLFALLLKPRRDLQVQEVSLAV